MIPESSAGVLATTVMCRYGRSVWLREREVLCYNIIIDGRWFSFVTEDV
jgi:hypothetical protein